MTAKPEGYSLLYRVLHERYDTIPTTLTKDEARAISNEVDRQRRTGEPPTAPLHH
ncbi:hypothetical protein [Cellulosimicrobium marinum]|uniref:hypothetical protein n=1 Tax=Cellulosimicrobium marinum TaxID=1638992 RepID=UPI001E341B0F|nr:hypothetical protein [Cellulosimicrobium marinum]MCB7138266.1 hypothetical protein [Cellulosimicrobium marinum]